MNKMLILTSHFPPKRGGVETGIQYYLDCIDKSKNLKATVITYENRCDNSFIDYWNHSKIIRVKVPINTLEFMTGLKSVSRINTLPKKVIFLSLHIYYLLKGCIANKEEIRESNIIIAKGALVESAAGYILSLVSKKKLFIRWRTDVESFLSSYISRIVLKKIFKRASKIVVNGEDIAESIRNLLKDDLENKITVAKNAIDTNIFYPVNINISRKNLDLMDKNFIILFASALNETKFCDEIIDAADKLLHTNSKDFFFIFIGEGPLEESVNQLYHRYPDNILFKNKFLNQQLLASFINASDVVIGTADICYPSRVVLESLACSVSVLLINSSIHDEKRGTRLRFSIDLPQIFMVNPNSDAITNVILKKHEQIKKIREDRRKVISCHDYVKSKYSKERVIGNEIDIFFK